MTKTNSATISMTGFGKAVLSDDKIEISVEVKSVNHKFLDTSIRIPRGYNEYESEIRSEVSKFATRGRVEVSVSRKVLSEDAITVNFNQPLFETYYGAGCEILNKYQALSEDTRVGLVFDLATNKDFLSVGDDTYSAKEKKLLIATLRHALASLAQMKQREGATLRKDLSIRLKNIRQLQSSVAKLARMSSQEKATKLKGRLEGLLRDSAIDSVRLSQEIAIIADKIDVSEELVRILSHLDQMESSMQQYPQGRKLDFQIQELFREWNTIGSKTQDVRIQNKVVEAKVEIEKLREQVQNVE